MGHSALVAAPSSRQQACEYLPPCHLSFCFLEPPGKSIQQHCFQPSCKLVMGRALKSSKSRCAILCVRRKKGTVILKTTDTTTTTKAYGGIEGAPQVLSSRRARSCESGGSNSIFPLHWCFGFTGTGKTAHSCVDQPDKKQNEIVLHESRAPRGDQHVGSLTRGWPRFSNETHNKPKVKKKYRSKNIFILSTVLTRIGSISIIYRELLLIAIAYSVYKATSFEPYRWWV